jgi:hypothetical protein
MIVNVSSESALYLRARHRARVPLQTARTRGLHRRAVPVGVTRTVLRVVRPYRELQAMEYDAHERRE